MRKALNIGEAELKLGHDFKHAFGLVFCTEALRHLRSILVWAAHVSDRFKRKHERSTPPVVASVLRGFSSLLPLYLHPTWQNNAMSITPAFALPDFLYGTAWKE